jgi:hypothetical protein
MLGFDTLSQNPLSGLTRPPQSFVVQPGGGNVAGGIETTPIIPGLLATSGFGSEIIATNDIEPGIIETDSIN